MSETVAEVSGGGMGTTLDNSLERDESHGKHRFILGYRCNLCQCFGKHKADDHEHRD